MPPPKEPKQSTFFGENEARWRSWILAWICQIGKLIKGWSESKPLQYLQLRKAASRQAHSHMPAPSFAARSPKPQESLSRFSPAPTSKPHLPPFCTENTQLLQNMDYCILYNERFPLCKELIGCYSCAQQRQKGEKTNKRSLAVNT